MSPEPSGPDLTAVTAAARKAITETLDRTGGWLLGVTVDELAAAVAPMLAGSPADLGLLTRTQMAARRDVHISTFMSWMTRYGDFPAAADTSSTDHRWYWPDVEAYLNAKGLPKMRRAGAQEQAAERETRILAALRLYPDGLTSREIADLTGSEEPTVRGRGKPTDHGILVRVEDRMRRLETAGSVIRQYKPGLARRSVITWKLAPEGTS